MIGFKRGWAGRAISTAMAAGLMVNGAFAAGSAPEVEKALVPSAASLVRFYPTPLSSTPAGTVEDQAVWLAKVQGLMAKAPSMFQQSILMSQTKHDFAANVSLLQQLQSGSIQQSMNLRSKSTGDVTTKVLTDNLGDSSNVVYKPLEPCRILDTRNASGASGVQGPIAGGSLKNIPGYITAGGNWATYGQTGTLSDCGLNSTYGASIYAVAIVITILNPNFDAYLGVSDSGSLTTTLSNVALNYTHGEGISTLYVVPQISSNTIYFALPTGLSANIIFDVVGFYHRSDATALECTTVSASTSIAANTDSSTSYPACATGYTRTGGYCFGSASVTGLYLEETGANACVYRSLGGATGTGTAVSQCCRVPGR